MSFFEIFQPGLRHLREERDRLKTLVSRPKHGGEGPLGIDLDGGKATFRMPVKDATEGAPPADADAGPVEPVEAVEALEPPTEKLEEALPRNDPGEPSSVGRQPPT
jgi:hypothetical protein